MGIYENGTKFKQKHLTFYSCCHLNGEIKDLKLTIPFEVYIFYSIFENNYQYSFKNLS